MSSVFCNRAIG